MNRIVVTLAFLLICLSAGAQAMVTRTGLFSMPISWPKLNVNGHYSQAGSTSWLTANVFWTADCAADPWPPDTLWVTSGLSVPLFEQPFRGDSLLKSVKLVENATSGIVEESACYPKKSSRFWRKANAHHDLLYVDYEIALKGNAIGSYPVQLIHPLGKSESTGYFRYSPVIVVVSHISSVVPWLVRH